MRVLGISIWIHFILIFVVGVLLFFYIVHDGFEGFQVGGAGTGAAGTGTEGTNPINLGTIPSSYIPQTPVYVTDYNTTSQTWQSINIDTNRLTYQQRLPVGAKLVSQDGVYTLLFASVNKLILYKTQTMKILWQSSLPTSSSYIFHQGEIRVFLESGARSIAPFPITTEESGSVPLTTTYLKIENNGDLVLYALDGSILFNTNTGVGPNLCNPINLTYPLQRGDCFTLQNLLTQYAADIVSYTRSNNMFQAQMAQQSLCASQAYYDNLLCDKYIETTSNPASAPPPVAPNASMYGSLQNGSNKIMVIANEYLTIKVGDMLYMGHGTNIQGPFIVEGTRSTPLQSSTPYPYQINITITKYYVGADIVYPTLISLASAIQLTSVIDDERPLLAATRVTTKDGLPLIASLYPDSATIDISSTSNSLPNVSHGDIIYINSYINTNDSASAQDPSSSAFNKVQCNAFDSPYGYDAYGIPRCISYLCKMGEIDQGNNICEPYSCSSTSLDGISVQDTNNGDGTCTAPNVYTPCQTGESYVSSTNSCVNAGCNSDETYETSSTSCVNASGVKRTSDGIKYTYVRGLARPSFVYDVTKRGIKGQVYAKPFTHQFASAQYEKPFTGNRSPIFNLPPFIDRPTFYSILAKQREYGIASSFIRRYVQEYFNQSTVIDNQIILQTLERKISAYIELANSLIPQGYGFALTPIINDITTRETYILSNFTDAKNIEELAKRLSFNGGMTQPNILSFSQYILSGPTKCLELIEPYNKLVTTVDSLTTPQTNINNNPSYVYQPYLGPFVVAAQPTSNKILIRSIYPDDLDVNGKFKMSANSARRAAAIQSARVNDGAAALPVTPVTFIPSQSVTQGEVGKTLAYNIVPDKGFINTRIYKLAYSYNSYAAITPIVMGRCTTWSDKCCPVGYSCNGTSPHVACGSGTTGSSGTGDTYSLPGQLGACRPCPVPSTTTFPFSLSVCGQQCRDGTFAAPGTNICNLKDTNSNNGTVSCTTYCGGTGGAPWNGELPASWNGAICVGTPDQPGLGCDTIRGFIENVSVKCRCQASPGKGWN